MDVTCLFRTATKQRTCALSDTLSARVLLGALGLTISRVTKNALGTNGMDNNPYQTSATNAELRPHGTVARAILRRNASTWVLGGIAIGLAIALFGPFVVMFVTQDTDTYPLKKVSSACLWGFWFSLLAQSVRS